MSVGTSSLIRTELQMLYNQFFRTISSPSMLTFYGITLVGTYFVSSVISSIIAFAPMFADMGIILESNMDITYVYPLFGLLTTTAVITGYFGSGPALILQLADEHLLMPAPILPHQLFITRYIRRLVRRFFMIGLGGIVLYPVMISGQLNPILVITFLIALLVYFEINYFLGGLTFYFKMKLQNRTRSNSRHILLPALAALAFIPTLQPFTNTPAMMLIIPSNAFASVLTEITGIFAGGVGFGLGLGGLALAFLLTSLLLAIICDYDYYEVFSSSRTELDGEGRISKIIRGEVDFSLSRFDDPTMWVILKDFWSRMRTPLQFWKYVYVVVGIIFVLYLNIFQPPGIVPIAVPDEFSYAAIPSFLFMIVLMTQMASVTSLLSFVDERDNVYLMKASTFRPRDIIMGKYLLSLFEGILASIPIYGLILYFLRVDGALYLISLAGPMILIFCAAGVMFGAYIPVFTNDPRTPPVPLAFAYPTLNLLIGSILIWMLAVYKGGIGLLIMIPLFTVSAVGAFIALSVVALRSYR
ncbi:MAG: hypothetical protein RTU30_08350 [Candidatus Thorarchaeota archaeon]